MTETLTHVDFDALFKGVAKCDRTDEKGVPCQNDAEWICTLLPCGCIRLICSPCKKIVSRQTSPALIRMLGVVCAKCLRNITGVKWDEL